MADRILKPDSGNDLVLQNDDGSGKIEINENASIPVTGTLDVSGATLTTSSAQKQAIVQAGPGSGTLDVSSGTFTTSTAQKTAIVDGGKGNLTKSDVGLGNVTNDAQVPASGGTFSGDVAVTGNVSATGNIQVDDIVEKTTHHGVEIEQVTLKDGSVSSTVSAGTNINLEKSTGGAISFSQGGVQTATIEDVQSQGGLRFYTGTSGSVSERLRIDSSGDVYSTAFTARTWSFSGFVGGSVTQYSGGYKRIGKMVYVQGYLGGTSDTNSLSISNLPYAAKSGSEFSLSVGYAVNGGSGTGDVSAHCSGSTITFRKNGSSSGWTAGNTGKEAMFAGWYEAESI